MRESRFTEFRFARRFRAGNRALQILFSITLVAALNFLAAHYFTRIDLTTSGTHTLAPETHAYIRELREPVEIIVTIPKDEEVPELVRIHRDLERLLREYEAAGRRGGDALIKVEFVDIYRQRKRAQELANRHGLTRENVILVVRGDRRREVRQAELYEVENGGITGFAGERALTTALLEVSSNRAPTVSFLVGHGEMRLEDVDPLRGLSQLEAFLRERNFQLATLDLATGGSIPEETDLIVVPSPQAALLPEEVEKLRRYMDQRNGRMLVLLDPGRRHGLDELLGDWGVMVPDMVIIDTGPDYRATGGDLIIRRFTQHPITSLLIKFQITALFGQSRPVRVDPLTLEDERLRVIELIGTSELSWADSDFRWQDPLVYDARRDLLGPVGLATVSERTAGAELGISLPTGRLVVIGNSDFIANNRLGAFGNQTLFLNAVNWALDRSRLLNVPSRPIKSHQIVLSTSDLHRLLLYFSILPTLAAAAGGIVFLIRRR